MTNVYPTRTAQVTRAMNKAGIVGELVKGEGYFYFVGDAFEPDAESVMVYRLGDMTLDRWVEEAKLRVKSDDPKAVPVAHFTLDGTPLCECQYVANYDRLNAAGSPPCSDVILKQQARFTALSAQFPGRVALVVQPCPTARNLQ
jgi:hypothetical protein